MIKWLIRNIIAWFLATKITAQFFDPQTWSFYLANFAVFVIVYEIARWAFERKVADLHFEGKKIGTMKEDE